MTTTLSGPTNPSEAQRRRRKGPVLLLVLVVLVLGAGIAGLALARDSGSNGLDIFGGPDGTKPKTEAQKVEEAYRNYWDANFKAGEIPDPSSPLFFAYATDQQARRAASDLEELRQQGLAGRQVANSISRRQVSVLAVQGDTAQLTDCAVDDSIVVQADTGEPAFEYTPGKASTTLFNAQMVRENGSWKVASLTRQQRWEGVGGCALGQS